MALIKGQTAAGLLKEAIVLDLGDLGRQAARMQAAAEAKARKIIADAELEAARLTQDAHAKGLEQGRAEGAAQGRAEGLKAGRAEAMKQSAEQFKQLQAAWLDTGRQWEARRSEIDREAQQAVLELALRLAEKLVHRIIQVDPTVVVDQLGAALSHVLGSLEVTVHICPADRPVLEESMPELMAEFGQFNHIRLVDDDSITPGGCVVSYGRGRVDATTETQFQRVIDLMLPAQGGESENDTETVATLDTEQAALDGAESGEAQDR